MSIKHRLPSRLYWSIFTARIRRMGKVMFSVCPHLGGYPYPIMLCNISQNAMGQTLGWGGGGTLVRSSGGVPCWGVPWSGPAGGVPCWGVPCCGGTLVRVQPGGYPGQVQVQPGGVPWQKGTLSGGTLVRYPPLARAGWGGTLPGGTQVGQTEGVLNTWRAVCLLRSRRRTFLFSILSNACFLGTFVKRWRNGLVTQGDSWSGDESRFLEIQCKKIKNQFDI